SDEELAAIVSDVGGHDLGSVLGALDEADHDRDRSVVILAHTIKGWGLPIAADPLNHTALLTAAQVGELRTTLGVKAGDEWAAFPSGSAEAAWIRALPPLFSPPAPTARPEIPEQLDESYPDETSTQEAFGRVLGTLARRPAGDAIVTVSADVAVTTHLAGWINRKGLYFPEALPGIAYYEPVFAREVEWILLTGLRQIARREGDSLYLRLSTRPLDQRLAPAPDPDHRADVLRGGYRLVDARPEPGWDAEDNAVNIFAAGVMVADAVAAARQLHEHGVLASVFAVTSADRLYRGLREPDPHLLRLVGADDENVPL